MYSMIGYLVDVIGPRVLKLKANWSLIVQGMNTFYLMRRGWCGNLASESSIVDDYGLKACGNNYVNDLWLHDCL